MKAKDIVAFQLGNAEAIQRVASSSSAVWTGMTLVVLTAIARNYDQSFIAEKPVMWLLGPLLFSLVSGTWVFGIAYGIGARQRMKIVDWKKPSLWPKWRGFMGAFWMTAPIAWLYAIPVERFLETIPAAKANLALLGVVSLWRVLLMSRVMQVICGAPFYRALLWVLVPAFAEVIFLAITSVPFSKRIMAAMAGLRNSPVEDLLLHAFDIAFKVSAAGLVISVLILLTKKWNGEAREWPDVRKASVPVLPLGMAAVFWIGVAIPSQIQLQLNHHLEQLIAQGHMEEAVAFMNGHERDDFGPGRPLPPKLYEYDSVRQAFRFAEAVSADDKDWVRRNAAYCLEVVTGHLAFHWRGDPALHLLDADRFRMNIQRLDFEPAVMSSILTSTNPAPEVMHWATTYTNLLSELHYLAGELSTYSINASEEEKDSNESWRLLGGAIEQLAEQKQLKLLSSESDEE